MIWIEKLNIIFLQNINYLFTNATCTIIVNAPAILFVYMCKNTLAILELFSITHVYETDPFTVCTSRIPQTRSRSSPKMSQKITDPVNKGRDLINKNYISVTKGMDPVKNRAGFGQKWSGSGQNWCGSGQNWSGSGQNWSGSGQNWSGSGQNWYGSATLLYIKPPPSRRIRLLQARVILL